MPIHNVPLDLGDIVRSAMNADESRFFSPSQYSTLPSQWVIDVAMMSESPMSSYREIFATNSSLLARVTHPAWRASVAGADMDHIPFTSLQIGESHEEFPT